VAEKRSTGSELQDFIGAMDARLRMGKSGCDEILNDPFQMLNGLCDFA
jgi:hypothetical protein